jgi:Zn-finger nucleic acid-binding protein
MRCPRCQKDVLTKKMYENVEVDQCTECQGVWLDHGEIKTIVDTVQATFSNQLVQEVLQSASSSIPDAEKTSIEQCPKCNQNTTPLNFNYSSGVIVDVCPAGHGIWLDQGEIEKIQAQMEHWNSELPLLKEKWKSTLQDVHSDAQAARKNFNNGIYKKLNPIGDLAFYIANILH